MARKYLIETYGCQMNFHDSERMGGLLEQAGFEATADERDADVVVINTCSVREKAEEKLFTRLGEFRQMALEEGERRSLQFFDATHFDHPPPQASGCGPRWPLPRSDRCIR